MGEDLSGWTKIQNSGTLNTTFSLRVHLTLWCHHAECYKKRFRPIKIFIASSNQSTFWCIYRTFFPAQQQVSSENWHTPGSTGEWVEHQLHFILESRFNPWNIKHTKRQRLYLLTVVFISGTIWTLQILPRSQKNEALKTNPARCCSWFMIVWQHLNKGSLRSTQLGLIIDPNSNNLANKTLYFETIQAHMPT